MGVGVGVGVGFGVGFGVGTSVGVVEGAGVSVGFSVGVSVGIGDVEGAAQANKLAANINVRIISNNETIVFRFTSVPLFALNLSYDHKL